jgi:hypothetical protein
MLGPVVYARAGGNFKKWMEHAEFRHPRNKNEAQVWCEVLDGMLDEGMSVHSRAFEAAARRLAAVSAADKYNNWDLATVISDGHAPGGDLLPLGVLDSFSTHLSRTSQLFRRAAGAGGSGNSNNLVQPQATAAYASQYDDQLQQQQQQAPGQQRPYINGYRGGRSRSNNPQTTTTSASTTAAGPASGTSSAQ